MKVLVTGSKGQLGRELDIQGKQFGLEMLAVDLPQLDITDPAQVEGRLAVFQPSLVVNAAAYTHVDQAESEAAQAFAVNENGPANLARSCETLGIPLIQISTDYVFDGQKKAPYTETDPMAPLSVYGQSKAEGEKKVRALLSKHIILRTSWLYGTYGRNFVKTMLALGKEKPTIQVVDDQSGSPTCAADLAQAVWTIAGRIREGLTVQWGTYHYCGQGITTWHQFAETIFALAKPYGPMKVETVVPVRTAQYPRSAKRPPFSALDCSRIAKFFGIRPTPWQESLKMTIHRLLSDKTPAGMETKSG